MLRTKPGNWRKDCGNGGLLGSALAVHGWNLGGVGCLPPFRRIPFPETLYDDGRCKGCHAQVKI